MTQGSCRLRAFMLGLAAIAVIRGVLAAADVPLAVAVRQAARREEILTRWV